MRPSASCSIASPRNSILGRFDVTVIAHYFPEFERELSRYLERA